MLVLFSMLVIPAIVMVMMMLSIRVVGMVYIFDEEELDSFLLLTDLPEYIRLTDFPQLVKLTQLLVKELNLPFLSNRQFPLSPEGKLTSGLP